MVLKYDESTGYLPLGTHCVTWEGVVRLCGFTQHRAGLIAGLRMALLNLKLAGCSVLYLDGSFVSMKVKPNDYDGAWEPSGVDFDVVDPVLLSFGDRRKAMKDKFKGELFVADQLADSNVSYREFFRTDKIGIAKGVLKIDVGSVL